jgi:hypothetical protein
VRQHKPRGGAPCVRARAYTCFCVRARNAYDGEGSGDACAGAEARVLCVLDVMGMWWNDEGEGCRMKAKYPHARFFSCLLVRRMQPQER